MVLNILKSCVNFDENLLLKLIRAALEDSLDIILVELRLDSEVVG